VTSSQKAKGDRAEREAAYMLYDELGIPVRRLLGAGRKDDVGDIHGIDGWVFQVCNWQDVTRALAQKPRECEQQQINAGATFGATLIRQRGGIWRAALTIPQLCTVIRELP
jgi:hypothetical protein